MNDKEYLYTRRKVKHLTPKQFEEFEKEQKRKSWEFCGYQYQMAVFRQEKNPQKLGRFGVIK